jgi:hypothetical protein
MKLSLPASDPCRRALTDNPAAAFRSQYAIHAQLESSGSALVRVHPLLWHLAADLGDEPGFRVLPKRWIVERTFSWIGRQGRMSKDYELQAGSTETFIHLVGIRLLLARLTRG